MCLHRRQANLWSALCWAERESNESVDTLSATVTLLAQQVYQNPKHRLHRNSDTQLQAATLSHLSDEQKVRLFFQTVLSGVL